MNQSAETGGLVRQGSNNSMKEKLETLLRGALTNLGITAETIVLEHPAELAHGEF